MKSISIVFIVSLFRTKWKREVNNLHLGMKCTNEAGLETARELDRVQLFSWHFRLPWTTAIIPATGDVCARMETKNNLTVSRFRAMAHKRNEIEDQIFDEKEHD